MQDENLLLLWQPYVYRNKALLLLDGVMERHEDSPFVVAAADNIDNVLRPFSRRDDTLAA